MFYFGQFLNSVTNSYYIQVQTLGKTLILNSEKCKTILILYHDITP